PFRAWVGPYLIGRTEVTQAQWSAVVRAAAGRVDTTRLAAHVSAFQGEDRPVDSVSWCDALRFANLLSALEGRPAATTVAADCEQTGIATLTGRAGYRLPTEVEWEYAARAGASGRFGAGDAEADLRKAGWILLNSGGATHPVCALAPSPLGLCDLLG